MIVALASPQFHPVIEPPADAAAEAARSLLVRALALLDEAGDACSLAACSVSLALDQLP